MEANKLTSITAFKEWLIQNACERADFKNDLESHRILLGGVTESETRFLEEEPFKDLNISLPCSDMNTLFEKIEKAEKALINDYRKVISEVDLPTNVLEKLKTQLATLEHESNHISKFRDNISELDVY